MTADVEVHVAAIARRHGLVGAPQPLAGGIANFAWRIGDHVLRIPRTDVEVEEVTRERHIAPWIDAARLRSPALVAAGLEPVPYTIYVRVDGIQLAACAPDHARLAPIYQDIGRQLAIIGSIEVPIDERAELLTAALPDTRGDVAKALAEGTLAPDDALAIHAWLDQLEPALGAPARATFLHKDVHPWNVLVTLDGGALAAIIDWGNASFGDPALELASMPLAAVPAMLAGYVDAGGAIDDGFVARSLWAGMGLACWELRGLDPAVFDRRWWRMPPGGWAETAALLRTLFPAHAP